MWSNHTTTEVRDFAPVGTSSTPNPQYRTYSNSLLRPLKGFTELSSSKNPFPPNTSTRKEIPQGGCLYRQRIESLFCTVTEQTSSGDPWYHQGRYADYSHRKWKEETGIGRGPQSLYGQSGHKKRHLSEEKIT